MAVTILDPQGQARDIPEDQVQAALAAGGKQAVKIADPQGVTRWIPQDQQDAALKAGGKLVGQDKGFLKSFSDASGLSAIGQAIQHPIDTISSIPSAVANEAKRSVGELRQAWNAPNPTSLHDVGQIVDHTLYAIPGIGGTFKEADEQAKSGNYAGAAGTGMGLITALAAPGILKETKLPSARGVIEGAVDTANSAKQRLYPTSQTPVPAATAARGLGKALVVPVQAMPNFLEAATQEAGTIKAYAAKNNIPINSTVDLAKAASETAKAVQSHFDNEILGPNAKDAVSVPSDYRGNKLNTEGSRATVGEINNRINAINQELSPNYRKATQLQTNTANVSDADLIAEKRKLTNILHDTLAEKTSLEPEEIASLRQQAGKLRTIADEVNLSANTNTTAAGKAAMGRSDIPTGTKLGIAERLLQTIQGGPEIIGNRAVNKALQQIEAKPLELPKPTGSKMIKPLPRESTQAYLRRRFLESQGDQ